MAWHDTEARWIVGPLLDLTPQQLAQLQAQLNVIQTAWIQFIVVCLAAVSLIWLFMQWLYKARIEKIKHLFELANAETEIKTKKVDRLQDELDEQVESFTKEIQSLSNEVESLKKRPNDSKELSPEMLTPGILSSLAEKVSSLTKNVSSIESKVGELGKANNDVSVAVRSAPWAPSMVGVLRDMDGFGALRKLNPDQLKVLQDIGKPIGTTLNSIPDHVKKRD
jgi:hypothetical protein